MPEAGDVVVITGGGSGIGRSVALLAAQRGIGVAVLARTAEAVRSVAAQALELGAPKARGIVCDVASEDSVESAFEEIDAQIGPFNGLFANAGIELTGFAHELDTKTWESVIATNLTGAFLTGRAALRRLVEAGRQGALVFCSSPASFVGFSAGAASCYSASKGGVSALVRSLAVDYARYGIRVNAVVPGATDTPMMWAGLSPEQCRSRLEQLSLEIPLGRLANPDEPAEAVLWLLSDKARYVTGTHLICDGGILAKGSISV